MSRTLKDRSKPHYRRSVGSNVKAEAKSKRRTLKHRYPDLTDPGTMKKLGSDPWKYD